MKHWSFPHFPCWKGSIVCACTNYIYTHRGAPGDNVCSFLQPRGGHDGAHQHRRMGGLEGEVCLYVPPLRFQVEHLRTGRSTRCAQQFSNFEPCQSPRSPPCDRRIESWNQRLVDNENITGIHFRSLWIIARLQSVQTQDSRAGTGPELWVPPTQSRLLSCHLLADACTEHGVKRGRDRRTHRLWQSVVCQDHNRTRNLPV